MYKIVIVEVNGAKIISSLFKIVNFGFRILGLFEIGFRYIEIGFWVEDEDDGVLKLKMKMDMG